MHVIMVTTYLMTESNEFKRGIADNCRGLKGQEDGQVSL